MHILTHTCELSKIIHYSGCSYDLTSTMSKKRQRPASLNHTYVNNDYKRMCVGNSFLDRNRQDSNNNNYSRNNNNYTRNNNQYQQQPSLHHQLNNGNYHNINSQYRPPLPPQQKVYAINYTQTEEDIVITTATIIKIDNKNNRKIRVCTYGDKCFNEKCKFDQPNGKNRTGLIEKRVKYKVEAKASGDMFIDQQKLTDPKKFNSGRNKLI